MSTNSTNNNRATHYGTCQLCGSLQKANRKTNRLADHGYTLAYGFQAGTCRGSSRLPFEVCKAFAEEVLALRKKQVAEFVETPRPESTAKNRWDKCPKITAWQLARSQQAGRKNYIFWAEPRLANWAPSAQKTVREVEAVEASAKATRTGIRALSGAVKLAKRDLSKFGEHFQKVLEKTINGHLYDEQQAFWRVAIAAKNYDLDGRLPVWPKESEIVDIPYFTSNSVAKLARIARNSGNAELIAGAERLEKLSEVYEGARKAYAAAKA
jgi:hypothetical protein